MVYFVETSIVTHWISAINLSYACDAAWSSLILDIDSGTLIQWYTDHAWSGNEHISFNGIDTHASRTAGADVLPESSFWELEVGSNTLMCKLSTNPVNYSLRRELCLDQPVVSVSDPLPRWPAVGTYFVVWTPNSPICQSEFQANLNRKMWDGRATAMAHALSLTSVHGHDSEVTQREPLKSVAIQKSRASCRAFDSPQIGRPHDYEGEYHNEHPFSLIYLYVHQRRLNCQIYLMTDGTKRTSIT